MVQFLPAADQRPTKRQMWGEAFSTGLGSLANAYNESREEKKRLSQAQDEYNRANQFAKQIYGEDFELPMNPDLQKLILGEGLRSQREMSIEKLKDQRPKTAPGGLTGQSVPPEVSQAANQILGKMPQAGADELKMAMDEAGIPPIYSNPYVENRRRQEERSAASKDKQIEHGQKRAEKIIDKADSLGQELPLLESSIHAMEDAVLNEDLSFWSPDNLAEVTGVELFRTAKGAQFKTAAKNYFLNDLKSSGGRPNQFIEKQLVDALTKIGRSQEANQTVLESFKLSNDLKRQWHDTVRDLEKHYDETLGYLPGNLSRIAEETMKPYVEDRQKQYESRLKELAAQEKMKSKKGKSKESEKSKSMIIRVQGPDGQIYETESDNAELLPEGYKIL